MVGKIGHIDGIRTIGYGGRGIGTKERGGCETRATNGVGAGNRKCDASATPAVFVGKPARANAKGTNAVETARAGTKGVR